MAAKDANLVRLLGVRSREGRKKNGGCCADKV
jgi:hypothetical protein